ncbi:hypothetical protein GCM10009069_27710 [Algimonas arctica]|uniref:Lipoprotein n=1 Tax=Algimonas arctica TaxID=1479486 RepID=A0A8J3G3G4_9PROT|nr:hypothetical protein [Algimonas arctica]GHB03536.1 hypothetical protein GCM10009069_27710 [Algimonas arctica]
MFNSSLKCALLATAAGLALSACGGSTTSSPGQTGGVIINPPTSGGGSGSGNTEINLVGAAGCDTGTTQETITTGNTDVIACTITGTVTENLTLSADNGYALEGAVFIGEDGGRNATLTIPAGTQIFGKAGEDYLVVSRGSRLNARGSVTEPVIMTSIQDIAGTVDPVNDRGQWGGLIINGSAPINDCIDGTAIGGSATCEKSGEGSSGLFGGANPSDNSGTLQYLQVKYAGNLINDEDELNGIAFQGVGSGTTCDHIQIHNNADDGVEFFGGSVVCDYVVLTGIGDDSLDWTDGWVGGAQYVLVKQGPGAGDRGIEGDNRSSNNSLTPTSDPLISNFTFLGGDSGDSGIVVRAGTEGRIINGVIVGFQDAGVDVDEESTLNNLSSGELSFASLFLDNNDNIESGDDTPAFDTETAIAGSPNVVQGNNSLADEFFPGAAEQAVTATDPMLAGFENAGYIGAFSATETKDSNWAQGWTFGLFESPTECPAGTLSTGDVVGGKQICSLTGTITANVRLNNNFVYQLEGAVFIGEDLGGDTANPIAGRSSAILTIDAGTTVFAATGTDYLVISRGSQIRSNGTRTAPINMTSRDEVFGTADTANDRGKWGGLIINGRAPINDCIDGTATGGAVGCEKSGEGSSGLFGGGASDDNSGNLFYTRVSFAGNLINDEDELNGIAFQGVGSATQVDYVQVHNNVDDGVEFFGGTVNVKHLVLTGIGDDSLDWTDGWAGKVQYVIVDQADGAGDRAIEGDNRSSNNGLTPRSNPIISNVTFVGGDSGDTGIVLRAGTNAALYNGIVTGFQDAGFDIDDAATAVEATAGRIQLNSMMIVGNVANLETDGDAGDAAQATVLAAGSNNVTVGSTTIADETYVPGAPEQAVTATNVNAVDPFFDAVTYIGAVEDANDTWYQGWTLLVDQ